MIVRMPRIPLPGETVIGGVFHTAAGGKGATQAVAAARAGADVTLGERGAYYDDGSTAGFVPGFKVKAVDATAAGDVFGGALAVALAEGRPLPRAVLFANAAAALSVTKLGAQPSAPKRKEIEGFLGRERIRP